MQAQKFAGVILVAIFVGSSLEVDSRLNSFVPTYCENPKWLDGYDDHTLNLVTLR